MGFRIRELDPKSQLCKSATAEVITEIIPREGIEEIIEECGVKEERSYKFPALLTVLFVIAMNLLSELSQHSAFLRLVNGTRFLKGKSVFDAGSKSGISHARQRLGVQVMERIFKRYCRPLAETSTPGAFAFGLRLVAMDGILQDVTDTPANRAYFGSSTNQHSQGAFPQIKGIHLCECGTHAIFDTIPRPYAGSEQYAAYDMLRSITEGMLVLMDKGLYSFDMIFGILARKSHVLAPLPANVRPKFVRRLSDGSYLAWIKPSQKSRHYGKKVSCLVRIIEYTLDDPNRPGHGEVHRLVTTLLDEELYPALELIALYHERWEIEITFDEFDTHLQILPRPFRSRTPLGVLQEFYGMLIAHYIIRALMFRAAETVQLDPDRLSFINSVRLVCDYLPLFQLLHPQHHQLVWKRLLEDITYFKLPERELRINPRRVKRRQNKFKQKAPRHLNPPRPKPFLDAVVLNTTAGVFP